MTSHAVVVNDQQSRLNETRVAHVVEVSQEDDVRLGLQQAERLGLPAAICGGRHAMGGQQFAKDGLLLDMTNFNRVRSLDANAGLVEAEAGIFWPTLLTRLDELQDGVEVPWSIRQKQTGVDDVSLGGSLAANIHGRGLRMRPFVDDIESFKLMNAGGEVLRCSRTENADL
ncbi:MAG: FAD-dependent oxidoreductase, partial [Planctomycetota bacterium]